MKRTAHVEPVLPTADQLGQLGGTVRQIRGSKDSAHLGGLQSRVAVNHGDTKARRAR